MLVVVAFGLIPVCGGGGGGVVFMCIIGELLLRSAGVLFCVGPPPVLVCGLWTVLVFLGDIVEEIRCLRGLVRFMWLKGFFLLMGFLLIFGVGY